MTNETETNNLLMDVLKQVPKEALKQWCIKLFTIGMIILGATFFSIKSKGQLFSREFPNVIVYARLDERVNPGDTVELYPPSLQKMVPQTLEVEWELPFEQIKSTTLELQRRTVNAQGTLIRETMAQLSVKDKPVVAFLLK